MPIHYQSTELKNIADALRVKTKTNNPIAAKNFAATISNLAIIDNAIDHPTQWLSMKTNTEGNYLNVLVAIFPNNTNPISFSISGSSYSVNWGDETMENYDAAAVASHTYSYQDISDSTIFEQRGYKQALIQIKLNGTTTAINFNIKPASILSNDASSTILAIDGVVSNYASLSLRGSGASSLFSHRMLESIRIVGSNAQTNFDNLFSSCYSLKSIDIDMTNATSLNNTYAYCDSLESIRNFNSANVKDFTGCFFRCASLSSTPVINFTSATTLTNIFSYCYNLRNVNITQNTLTKNIVIGAMMMTAEAINNIFAALPPRVGLTSLIITITDCPGKTNCDTTIATNKNWTVVIA